MTMRDGVQSRDCGKTNRFKEIAFFLPLLNNWDSLIFKTSDNFLLSTKHFIF